MGRVMSSLPQNMLGCRVQSGMEDSCFCSFKDLLQRFTAIFRGLKALICGREMPTSQRDPWDLHFVAERFCLAPEALIRTPVNSCIRPPVRLWGATLFSPYINPEPFMV